jgi:hypothetical protein
MIMFIIGFIIGGFLAAVIVAAMASGKLSDIEAHYQELLYEYKKEQR